MTYSTPSKIFPFLVLAVLTLTALHAVEETNTLGAVAAKELPPIAPGRFQPTDESLKQYQYPEWFRDAKFGFWSHWGPVSYTHLTLPTIYSV